MGANRQQARRRSQRPSSKLKIEQYFFPKSVSTFIIATTTAGALSLLAGVVMLLIAAPASFIVALVLAGSGLLLIGIDRIRAIIRSNPTDEDYDHWLRHQASTMLPAALFTLNMDESQLTSQPLILYSFILPGSSLASDYHDHIHLKQGKDGRWRSSINLYTYFLPSQHFIAMFTRSVNALDQFMPFDDSTEEFFYRDIISASFSRFPDTVIIEGQEFVYRVQQLSLKISNGDDIRLGAYLSAEPLSGRQNAPFFIPLDNHCNQTLAELRRLLRFRKQGIR